MRTVLIAFSLAVASALPTISAWPSSPPSSSFAVAQNATSISPADSQKVIVRFTWKVKGEYAPLYVALDKGYYAAEGLDVQFAEGSGSETVVKMIGLGTDNIGYGSATVIPEAVDRGLPVEVVAVYQPSVPIALISFPDEQLNTPKDLEGKKIGISIGEVFANVLEPFAKFNNIDLNKVTVVLAENSVRNAQFSTRKIDVTTVFLNNELPFFEKKLSVRFNVLKIGDYGLNLLGASFFVNDGFAKANPELLRKLLRATGKGYRDAKADPESATDIMAKHMRTAIDREILEQQVKATLDATPVATNVPLGWQSDAGWQQNLNLLKSGNAIQSIKELPAYYTNQYLQ